MQKIRILFLFSLLIAGAASFAQQSEVIQKYIQQYKDLAVAEMQRTGVPAAITLAQGIHESGAGMGQLATTANNHFGIKCKSTWTGESVKHNDDAKGECFRKYSSPEDSYKDHSDFLKNNTRYVALFSLDPEDYTGWANGLKQAGYATNPKYPQVLIKLIEDYNLQSYTLLALNKIPAADAAAGSSNETVMIKSGPAITETAVKNNEPATIPVYPEGEFKINETKVVFVKKGTSFLAIALQYKIDLAKLFEVNELPEAEASDKDQLVYLQRKRKTGNNKFHIVQAGETLHDIAQAEAIRLESLMELNWMQEGMQPAIGEQLSLQSKASSVPQLLLKENYSLLPPVPKKETTKN